ncbi:MAG TPA: mandelate racemase/muconate lactonizing enzyme family protein [Thermoleophilaceae bacterium]|jgi:galactonate dehydratase
MRITGLRTGVVGTPWRHLTLVELQTDEGLTGVGETRMINHTEALLGYLSEAKSTHVIGHDPFAIEALVQRMTRFDYGRSGEIAMSALAVLEMACWDIIGKALDQPVYALLGGRVRDRVKAYANGWYTVDRTPEEFHAAARAVVERGYRALKFDPFGAGFWDLERDERRRSIDLVEAVRDAAGSDVELMIEMHGRFVPSAAIEIARELEPFRPAWIEEPVPPDNLKALAKVSDGVNIPIATGERIHSRGEFRELFELQAADIVQPDIAHFGGILETRKLAATAETHYVLVAPHNVCGPVATAANLHVAACTPNFKIQEHFNDFADSWVEDVAPGLPRLDPADGCFPLPEGPGLGVTVDWDAVAEHPPEPLSFDLFKPGWEHRDALSGPSVAADPEAFGS